MKIKEFFELDAWQKGHVLVLEVYKITNDFPKEELYGIVSQLRRAASSITANIAEGFERYHFNDKRKFYYQARGSAAEVTNFIFLARDLSFVTPEMSHTILGQAEEVRRLLNGLIRSIEQQKI